MMKRILMTAAALMFSTSALAWAPAQEKKLAAEGDMVAASDWSAGSAMGATKTAKIPNDMDEMGETAVMGWSGEKMAGDMASMKLASGTAKVPNDMDDMAWEGAANGDMASMKLASSGTAKVPNDMDGMAWDGTASGDMASMKLASSGTAKVPNDMGDIAMADDGASWGGKGAAAMASTSGAGPWVGQGGPIEEVQAYPACRPGRGDDNCIQLYETGGRKILPPSTGSARLAMGGPFEPAANAGGKVETPATAEDHSAHAAAPATGSKPTTDEGPEDESFVEDTATPPAGKPEMTDAMGGSGTKAVK